MCKLRSCCTCASDGVDLLLVYLVVLQHRMTTSRNVSRRVLCTQFQLRFVAMPEFYSVTVSWRHKRRLPAHCLLLHCGKICPFRPYILLLFLTAVQKVCSLWQDVVIFWNSYTVLALKNLAVGLSQSHPFRLLVPVTTKTNIW